jgi:hypothetical protein
MGSGRSVSACLSLVTWALVSQETNDFDTQLFHRTRKMKDLFPPSSFTKTICNHWLVERLDPLSIVVLLKVEGKSCSHGRSFTIRRCRFRLNLPKGRG